MGHGVEGKIGVRITKDIGIVAVIGKRKTVNLMVARVQGPVRKVRTVVFSTHHPATLGTIHGLTILLVLELQTATCLAHNRQSDAADLYHFRHVKIIIDRIQEEQRVLLMWATSHTPIIFHHSSHVRHFQGWFQCEPQNLLPQHSLYRLEC